MTRTGTGSSKKDAPEEEAERKEETGEYKGKEEGQRKHPLQQYFPLPRRRQASLLEPRRHAMPPRPRGRHLWALLRWAAVPTARASCHMRKGTPFQLHFNTRHNKTTFSGVPDTYHFGSILLPSWLHFGSIFGSQFGSNLLPIWLQFGPSLVLVWFQLRPSLVPVWSQFDL